MAILILATKNFDVLEKIDVDDYYLTFGCFVPFPGRGEVRAALGAHEGRGGAGRLGVKVEDPGDALLEAAQVDKLRVRGVRDKMHLGRRRLRRRDLKIFAKSDNIFGDYHQGFHISCFISQRTICPRKGRTIVLLLFVDSGYSDHGVDTTN